MNKKSDGRFKDTKERLFKIAIDFFAEKGIEGTSIRDIVKKANISTAAFYNHYESKDALIQAIYDYYRSKKDEARAETEAEYREMMKTLDLVNFLQRSTVMFQRLMEDPLMAKLGKIVVTEKGKNPVIAEIVREDREKLLTFMEGTFTYYQIKGYFKGHDARLLGRMTGYIYLGFLEENVYLRYWKNESMDSILARQNKQIKLFINDLLRK